MLLTHIHRAAAMLMFSLLAFEASGRGYDSILPEEKFAVLDGVAYFAAAEGPAQSNLWRTDGTAEGTRRVSQAPPGATVRHPFVAGGRVVFFVRHNATLGVWEANGNTYETRLVTELANVQPELMRSAEGIAYFTSPNPDPWGHRTLLWRSDGTAAGTGLVRSLPFDVADLSIHEGLLYFRRVYDASLWRSDGTAAGTFSLDVPVTPVGTVERSREVIAGGAEGRVFFGSNRNLWQTDGTKEGTVQLLAGEVPTSAATLHGTLYLTTDATLYRVDGRELRHITTLSPYGAGPRLHGLVSTGETLYFFHEGLWAYDPVRGTRLIRQFSYAEVALHVRVVGDLVYVAVWGNLLRSDGTASGTVRLFEPSYGYHYYETASALTAFGGKLLFAGSEGIHGAEPWITDGTRAGTRMVANVRPETELRGRVYDRDSGAPVSGSMYLSPVPSVGITTVFETDAEGRFSIEGLPDGTYELFVMPPHPYVQQVWRNRDCRYCWGVEGDPIVAVAGNHIDGLDFPLSRGGSISGRIVDANGAPVAGVSVEITEGVSSSFAVATGISGENGEYVTSGTIPPGPRWFVLTKSHTYSGMIYDGGSCALGCESAAKVTPVAVGNGETITGIDFVVTPYGSVSGRILDGLTGRPIGVTATVTARGPRDNLATHSSNGVYDLSLRDGQYRLSVQVAGGAYTSAYYPNEPCADPGCFEVRGVPVSAVPGRTIPGHDLVVMPLGARIRGRVADGATGAPLPDIRITVLDARGALVARTLTKSNGIYETPPSLAPGTYRVRAEQSDGHSALTHPAEVTLSGTDIARGIDFLLDRLATITGSVVDAKTRQPLIGAQVVITDTAGTIVEKMRTGEDGRYTVSLLPGRFTAHAEKIGWVAKDVQVTVINGETGSAAFALEPACEVAVAPVSPVARAGGETTLTVSAPCAACAFETATFISILSGGCNSPALTLRFDENPGPARRGTIVFPGRVVEILQEGF
jgi:ELWxxDGT repeat protein